MIEFLSGGNLQTWLNQSLTSGAVVPITNAFARQAISKAIT